MYTPQDLQDELDADLAWRRVELQAILIEVRGARGTTQQALMRAGVALLYAHWEGITKAALTHYLRYVSRRKLRLSEVGPGFARIAVEHEIARRPKMSEVQRRTAAVRILLDEADQRFLIPAREVNTGGNLNSAVCRDLFETLGLDFGPFLTKTALIDYNLLRARNDVAHGRWTALESRDYENLHDEVLIMLSTIRTLVMSAVDNLTYRRHPSAR